LEDLVAQLENQSAKQKAVNILREFNESALVEFSKEITWEVNRAELPSTGMTLIDVDIDYYRGLAEKHGIDFELTIDGDVRKITGDITQFQLETLVTNMLDNAIIAVRKSDVANGRIAIHLWERELTVEDNGEAFSESVLADLSRCRETLIPDEENGGGIGFVTMFEITNECRASVEVMQGKGIKSVTVRFDGQNLLVVDKK
jgi:signal transduction histidine kinase